MRHIKNTVRSNCPMIALNAFVPWRPSEGEDIHPHPSPVCEPVNLAATALPPLEYVLRNVEARGLSTLQQETIRRIMQSFDKRKTFLLGDATGVGKGRTIAGMIAEIAAKEDEIRVAWISANMRLEEDARREIDSVKSRRGFDEGVRFSSYTALQVTTRVSEFVQWLSQVDSPVIVLDECHALRNSKGVVAQIICNMIVQMRTTRPELRILYSSATACSVARHCEYLGPLGLFGTSESPFSSFSDLHNALKKHGPSLMELMAIDLRARGAYVARQLSCIDLSVEHRVINLNCEQKQIYNSCGNSLRVAGVLRGSSQQSFFQRLITALKVDETIRLAEHHVASGSSVVISLLNTGEAVARRMSDANAVHFVGEEALDMYEAEYVDGLPENPLDRLVTHFGGAHIAELTGRRFRTDRRTGLRTRTPSLHEEVDAFQSGQKHVAVLSRAGGVGISLHDSVDKRPRVHIILEIPWSAEDLIQQMGRTYRSNSHSPPTYILVTTDIPAELRFASSIVAKLQNFGAMVKADRTSCCFSFFRVPRWSVNERRSISLYLAMASAMQPNDPPFLFLTRSRAMQICGLSTGNVDSKMKADVIHLLQNASELGDRRLSVISAALQLWPQDLMMLTNRWNIRNHRDFPAAFKSQVVTLLLCAQAWETRNTLGLLDQDMLLRIIELISCPVTCERAKIVASRFRDHSLNDITSVPIDAVLNRMLGMEFDVQYDVLAIADAVVQPSRPVPTACLLRYAMERAGTAIHAKIADMTRVSFEGKTSGVCATVEYHVLMPEQPTENVEFWCHLKSGRACWIDSARQRLVFSDRREVQANALDPTAMRGRGYFRCDNAAWNRAVANHEHIATRRVRKLSKHFYLATQHAMQAWDMSAHRILRVPPTDSFPRGVIGLLMHTTG